MKKRSDMKNTCRGTASNPHRLLSLRKEFSVSKANLTRNGSFQNIWSLYKMSISSLQPSVQSSGYKTILGEGPAASHRG